MANMTSWWKKLQLLKDDREKIIAVNFGQLWDCKPACDYFVHFMESSLEKQEAVIEELKRPFENYHGCAHKAMPFRLWTRSWVYFSHEYDGKPAIYRVPRHPFSHDRVHIGEQ